MGNKSGDPRELALDSLLEDLAYRPRDDGLSSLCSPDGSSALEGVDGSSPSKGFKIAAKRGFLLPD